MTYFASDRLTIHCGDALSVAADMPDGSVDCIVTSPPYLGLRDYGIPGQYGLESSPAEYVENLRKLFAELRRVLADDGTLWLNLGDSYGGKNLQGIPWRMAFTLQDDAWVLRNTIIWHKPNAMPFSGKDRLANRYEHVFFFAKSANYHFDLDAIRVGYSGDRTPSRTARSGANKPNSIATPWKETPERGKNPGDVWVIPTQPFPGAHFAVMPLTLAEHCIKGACRPGGVVLDPFHGSGTTAVAALNSGRRYVGIELNPEFIDLSLQHDKRLKAWV